MAAPKTANIPAQRVRTTEVDDSQPRYEIIGYAEIPVDDIEINPLNPRPKFHLYDDDPVLMALGDSIRTQGQHHPALVYELVDTKGAGTGKYRLLQGESRWRACRIAKVGHLRCFIAATPTSEAEEWDWLGIEEAFKRDWQPFFVLRYAHNLATKHGVPMTSPEIAAKTGLQMADLRTGEKVFRLEPAIQALVAEYEQLMYEQLVRGARRRGHRLNGSGVRTKEFPVNKAAAVWDIFEAMRKNLPLLVQKYDNLELQRRIAAKASMSTVDDLNRLYGQIRQTRKNPPPGLLTEIDELLSNDRRQVRQFLRNTGSAEASKLDQFMLRSPKVREVALQIAQAIEQVGTDPDDLEVVDQEALELIRDVSEMQRALSRRIRILEKERR